MLAWFMRGTTTAQGSLSQVGVICAELLEEEGFLATLGMARGKLFTDADFDCLYASKRGRPSHPPSLLAALLLAQMFYGVSDREAERRSRLDLGWKRPWACRWSTGACPTCAWSSSGSGWCGRVWRPGCTDRC